MAQTVLLGEVAEVNPESVGRAYPYDDILYLDTSSVTENEFAELQPFSLANAPGRAKRIVRSGDIVYSTVRPNLKHYGYIESAAENTVASTGFAVIRAGDRVVPKYLYYWLTAEERTKYLASIADSQTSTFPAFNPSVLGGLELSLPELDEQRRIADILGTIDEKIDVNRKLNDTLERLGETLYRHYFVHNPDSENWPEGRVADVVDVYSGFAFKSQDFDAGGNYGLVTIKNVQDGSFIRTCTDRLGEPLPEKMPDYAHLESGDIILSLTGNVGRVCLVIGDNYLLNQRVAKLVGKYEYQAYAYFMFRSSEMRDRMTGISRGTAQMNLSPIETKNLKIKLPPAEVLREFDTLSGAYVTAIVANNEEIDDLIALRDMLLPRLISGKARALS